jgi:hypothetical protein
MIQPDRLVARVVMRAPEYKPGTLELCGKKVAFTKPPDSKQGANELALIGGKIEAADYWNKDFTKLTVEELITAGSITLMREILEELGQQFGPGLFQFVRAAEYNGWTTLCYAAELLLKPHFQIQAETETVVWIAEEQITHGKILLFADHLLRSQEALSKLNKPSNHGVKP